MKQFVKHFFANTPLSNSGNDVVLLLFRLFAGGLMLPYGWGKIEKYDQYCINFFEDPIGIGMIPSLWLTIFAQLGCSVMLAALISQSFTKANSSGSIRLVCSFHIGVGPR